MGPGAAGGVAVGTDDDADREAEASEEEPADGLEGLWVASERCTLSIADGRAPNLLAERSSQSPDAARDRLDTATRRASSPGPQPQMCPSMAESG